MRAVVCAQPSPLLRESVTVRDDVADPLPGPGEVLVEVAACALCRTDLQIAAGDLRARTLPIIPGHQVVGKVVATGPAAPGPGAATDGGVVPGFGVPGPRVSGLGVPNDSGVRAPTVGATVGLVWLAGSCGQCRFCRTGRENLCVTGEFTGWDRNGGMAELVTARADFVHVIPQGLLTGGSGGSQPVAVAVAPLLCGGVIGYRSLRVAGIGVQSAGMRLGLYGFGASATIALQIASHFGVECFVVTRSVSEQQRALALGASWAGTYDQRPPHPLDAAVTFAPSGDVVLAALRACERGATVAINAIHLDRIPAFEYEDLWWERSLRSVANVTRADVREFLDLVGPAGIRTQAEAVPLVDAPHAFQRLQDGDVSGALVFQP